MGTFKIKPTSLISNTWNIGQDTRGNILTVFQDTPGTGENINMTTLSAGQIALARLGFDLNTSIFLDGASVATPFASLQAGFTVNSSTVQAFANSGITLAGDGTAPYFMQFDPNTEGPANTWPFTYPGLINSMLTLVGGGMGFRGLRTAGGNVSLVNKAVGFYVGGNYFIASTSITASVSQSGNKLTLNNFTGVKPPGLSQIMLQYIDSNKLLQTRIINWQDWLYWDLLSIVFWLPPFGNFTGTVYIYGIGIGPGIPAPPDPGVQFYGSAFLGTITVTASDVSGMYVLVPGQAYDTIYNNARDGTTTNVNIQDPFVEIGPIP